MSKEYREFSPEFREEVTKLAIDSSKTVAEIAREYNMHGTTLGNWVRAYKAKHGSRGAAHPDRASLTSCFDIRRAIGTMETRIVSIVSDQPSSQLPRELNCTATDLLQTTVGTVLYGAIRPGSESEVTS